MLQRPKTQKAEILFELLNHNSINHQDIFNHTGILSPTARISDLRTKHQLNIKMENVKTKNKHGRNVRFGRWSIPTEEREKAIQVYLEINK